MRILLFLFSLSAFGSTEQHIRNIMDHWVKKDPRYMSRLPKPNAAYIKEVAYYIDKHAKAFGIPADLIVGIAAQESQFLMGAVNKRTHDFGIMQINRWHVKNSKLNKKRLVTDLDYGIYHGVRIFAWFYNTYSERRAIMGYNAGTNPKVQTWKPVIHYYNMVTKYRKMK